jgi:hypothetical protein
MQIQQTYEDLAYPNYVYLKWKKITMCRFPLVTIVLLFPLKLADSYEQHLPASLFEQGENNE